MPGRAESAMRVEVVFALPGQQALVTVELDRGATVAEAIDKSSLAEKFPEHDLPALRTGIWGHLVDRDHEVRDGDRVEIYRPLLIDPQETRRALAARGKTMAGAGKRDKQ